MVVPNWKEEDPLPSPLTLALILTKMVVHELFGIIRELPTDAKITIVNWILLLHCVTVWHICRLAYQSSGIALAQ